MKKFILTSCMVALCSAAFSQESRDLFFKEPLKEDVLGTVPVKKNILGSSRSKKWFDALSTESSWIGAQLFYNFDGSNLDNVVGAAKVKLNTAKYSTTRFKLNIIGNIAKFSSALDKEKLSTDLREISQSEQGLIVGFEPIYKLLKNSPATKLNLYGNLAYKINNFQNVNEDNESGSLSQARFLAGIEFEGLQFEDGNGMVYFSLELGGSFFDKNQYKKIFNEEKSSLKFIESTFIMPISGKFGLMLKYTITQYSTPAFGSGIVIKN
jgi:hypothetical protein